VVEETLFEVAYKPPVVNNSILVMLFVFATTANWSVASSAVLVPPSKLVNVAERVEF